MTRGGAAGWLGGWRVGLRLAAREARRARGRSVLVLVMIALPVLGVTCADVLLRTAQVGGTEALGRRVGTADALVSFQPGITRAAQAPDPQDVSSGSGTGAGDPDTSLAAVRRALGRPVQGIERRVGTARVTTAAGAADVTVTELDLRDRLATGLFALTAGRLPRSGQEVVVNAALADRGPGLGDTLHLAGGPDRRVVGIVRSTTHKDPAQAVGLRGAFGKLTFDDTSWLVDADGPVTWRDVRHLNRIGALVVSPWVLRHPPSPAHVPPQVRAFSGGPDNALITVIVLVTVMALIEVVLLAGPSFAVGARRLQRSLALVAASGGTRRQRRRIVLASAVVLGGVAAVGGVALGIGSAVLLLPGVQHFSSAYFGPFDVRPLELLGVAVFGFVSAVLAALVPAHLASRHDVVAVLARRRGERGPRARSPLAGVVLVAAGVMAAVAGARRASGGENAIAVGAILVVLGMVLLIPLVLALLGRLARRLPLTLRYAVRDAARHRTRTAPAVAAVAATVAGVVALGIGAASNGAKSRETYVPTIDAGSAVVTGGRTTTQWDELARTVRHSTGTSPVPVRGIRQPQDGTGRSYRSVTIDAPHHAPLSVSYSSPYGAEVVVGDRLPAFDLGIAAADRAAADQVLARGGAVVLTDATTPAGHSGAERLPVRLRTEVDDPSGHVTGRARVTVPALAVRSTLPTARAQAVLAPAAAHRLGVPVGIVGLWVPGPLDAAGGQDLTEAAGAASAGATTYVERGFRERNATRIAQLVLGALGALLMIGGTLTATFLALSDARGDLATLAAIGASPRVRRRVAAAYAAVTGLTGAVLGVLVGLVPGIAVSFQLTSTRSVSEAAGLPSHYLAIPWPLLAAVVLGVPALTAAVVGLATRSRLPLVARVD